MAGPGGNAGALFVLRDKSIQAAVVSIQGKQGRDLVVREIVAPIVVPNSPMRATEKAALVQERFTIKLAQQIAVDFAPEMAEIGREGEVDESREVVGASVGMLQYPFGQSRLGGVFLWSRRNRDASADIEELVLLERFKYLAQRGV